MASTRSSLGLLPVLSILFALVSSKPCVPIPSFTGLGCYTDNGSDKALAGSSSASDEMTLGKCAAFCWKFELFGLENGRECYCGHSLSETSLEVASSECSATCWGNGAKGCGAVKRLSLYTISSPVVLPSAASTTDSSTSAPLASSTESETSTASAEPSSTSTGASSTFADATSTSSEESSTSSDIPTTSPEVSSTSADVTSTTTDVSSTAEPTITSSTTSSEAVTASSEAVTDSSEAPSSSMEPSSTSSEESSTTTEVSSSITQESSTATEATEVSSTSIEVTTTEEPVATAISESSTSLIEITSAIPSSTTAAPTTTTEGPSLTTITDCPSIPTYAGTPDKCYLSKLPTYCDKLTSAVLWRSMSSSLRQCQQYLTLYGMTANPSAAACFPTTTAFIPTNSVSASSTMSSVWSCLQTASILCDMNSDCATKTYTVGQVPTPTPSIGVDLIQDGGFESGTLGAWTTSGFTADLTGEVSTTRPRTGSYSFHVYFPNTNGVSGSLIRTMRVEPGRQYQFNLWYYHTNPAAYMSLYMYIMPAGASTDFNSAQLLNTPANQWMQRTVTFTATTSWVNLQVSTGGNVGGTKGQAAYQNDVWIDDITLTRLN